jgi:hypothetical protein
VHFIEKKMWDKSMSLAPITGQRKALSAPEARSLQQSKFLITLTFHKRATQNDEHNRHVMAMMALSAEALFKDPTHLSSIFKFGLIWTENRWGPLVSAKDGAATTRVGHYMMNNQHWYTERSHIDSIRGVRHTLKGRPKGSINKPRGRTKRTS